MAKKKKDLQNEIKDSAHQIWLAGLGHSPAQYPSLMGSIEATFARSSVRRAMQDHDLPSTWEQVEAHLRGAGLL